MHVEGHAGYGTGSTDVVCAAASMLAQTMTQWAADHRGGIRRMDAFEHRDGFVHLDFWARRDCAEEAGTAMGVIEGGFRLLMDRYPGHIHVRYDADP